MDFSDDAANFLLSELEREFVDLKAFFHPAGGFKRDGQCDYDAYVAVGAQESFGASIAVRRPVGGVPYFAVVRKANGRRVSEDRLPWVDKDTAVGLFRACVEVAALQADISTKPWSAELAERP